jgi:hypothetical protein
VHNEKHDDSSLFILHAVNRAPVTYAVSPLMPSVLLLPVNTPPVGTGIFSIYPVGSGDNTHARKWATAALHQFIAANPQAAGSLAVYQGQTVCYLSDGTVAILWAPLMG